MAKKKKTSRGGGGELNERREGVLNVGAKWETNMTVKKQTGGRISSPERGIGDNKL